MSILLSDLLERHFLPEVIPHSGADYQGSFRVAIKWLAHTAGREPTLDDATPQNITAMQHALADAGMGWSRIRQLKIKIGSLRKHAYRMGLVDHYQAVPTIKVTATMPGYLHEVPGPDAIAGWYRQHFRPAMAERVQSTMLGTCDKAVERFDSIFESHVMLAEISEVMLEQFRAALLGDGTGSVVAQKECRVIRRILAAWNPERWPVYERKTISAAAAEEECGRIDPSKDNPDLTLGGFLEHVYLTERAVKPSTAEQMRISVLLFERWHGGGVKLAELTEPLAGRL